MKSNLIALKTQETQTELPLVIEPILTEKLAQVGVEIYKSTYFNKFENLNKSIFGLLENSSIILLDLSHPNADEILMQISKFYQTELKAFSQGKFLKDESKNRICVIFDLCDASFINNIDKNFLHSTFAPTKYVSVLKTFGLGESEVKKVLQTIPNSYGFEFFVTSNFLDCSISIVVDADFYKSKVLDDFIRSVYEVLGHYIYADEDLNLYQKLMEGLSIRNVKIAICDSLTYGLFFSEIQKNITDKKENILAFYNITKPDDIKTQLNINIESPAKYTNQTDEIIYEITYGVLQNSKADIAVVLAGSEQSPRIAVGDTDAIHLYKFNFDHSKSLIDNIMIQNAIFKLLKKIKKNDGLF